MKLSNDYSPLGKFSEQVFVITLTIFLGGLVTISITAFLATGNILTIFCGFISTLPAFLFMRWGHKKQEKELFG